MSRLPNSGIARHTCLCGKGAACWEAMGLFDAASVRHRCGYVCVPKVGKTDTKSGRTRAGRRAAMLRHMNKDVILRHATVSAPAKHVALHHYPEAVLALAVGGKLPTTFLLGTFTGSREMKLERCGVTDHDLVVGGAKDEYYTMPSCPWATTESDARAASLAAPAEEGAQDATGVVGKDVGTGKGRDGKG